MFEDILATVCPPSSGKSSGKPEATFDSPAALLNYEFTWAFVMPYRDSKVEVSWAMFDDAQGS